LHPILLPSQDAEKIRRQPEAEPLPGPFQVDDVIADHKPCPELSLGCSIADQPHPSPPHAHARSFTRFIEPNLAALECLPDRSGDGNRGSPL
jgi:hypothetical protein